MSAIVGGPGIDVSTSAGSIFIFTK
jgi:hypothetical protein